MSRPIRYVRPNMANLRGRLGREIIEQIRNTPHSDLSRLTEGAERCRQQLMAIKKERKEMNEKEIKEKTEEYKKTIEENRLSGIRVDSGDEWQNLMEEVFYAGFEEGYNHAMSKLELLQSGIFFAKNSNEFFEKNIEKIKNRIAAIKKYEAVINDDEEET